MVWVHFGKPSRTTIIAKATASLKHLSTIRKGLIRRENKIMPEEYQILMPGHQLWVQNYHILTKRLY